MNPLDFRIVLIRTCKTDWDDQDRLTGTLDVPLNDEGRSTAVDIARQLELFSFSVIISAPCLAAQETSGILATELGLRVRTDSSLVNVDLGMWQGKQISELKNCQPTLLRNWQESPDLVAPPHGETTDSVRSDVQKSLKRWTRKYRESNIILVVPEPLASVVKSDLQNEPVCELKQLPRRCGHWEWIQPTTKVLA